MHELQRDVEEGKAVKKPLKDRVVSAVFWLGATKTLAQAVTWVITIYVARILSPGDYGLMGMSGIFIGLICFFNEAGLGSAIIQKKTVTEDDLSSVFWLVIIVNTLLYLFSFAAAPLVAAFFGEPRLASIIRVAALNFIITGIGLIPYHMLSRELSFGKKSLAEFAGSLSGSFSTLVLAVKGYGVWSLAYGSIAGLAVTNLFYFVYYPWAPGLRFSFSKIGGMINFGLKVTVTKLLWYTYSNADYFVAGKFLGKSALGYYSLAFQFASVPVEKIVSLYTQVAFPAFSELQSEPARLKEYFIKSVSLVALMTFPLFLMIFLFADDAVRFFLTEKWSPIILPLKILCLVSTLRAINAINAPLVFAKGRPGTVIANNLLLAAVLPPAFYIGSFYGLEGLSYAWLFAFPVLFVIITRTSIRLIGLSLSQYFWELRHAFFGTAFMTAAVLFLQGTVISELGRPARLIGSAAAGALFYALYFIVFNRDVFAQARSLLERRIPGEAE